VSANDHLVTGDGPFGVAECADCQYGVTDPQLSDAELGPYYSIDYYSGYYEHDGLRSRNPLYRLRAAHRKRSRERRDRRPPFGVEGRPAGRVLDVGCGGGELLGSFAARGWQPYGIDPSEEATEAAARRGVTVHHGTLKDQPWEEGSFQLITFNHSLEHIVDPLPALEDARRLLAPAGALAIAVPNWACWQRRIFGDRWAMLDMPRHQQHFSPRALKRLADRLDLSVDEVGTDSNAISVAYSLHYLIAGHWTPGWKLWLSYALSLPLLPFAFLGDRFGGGDACYALMRNA
jgi:2-polyprenyl-3-methyl-5-hydroxy-6-metoxy-1,4-benzoquinol methylase